jgi:polysaccharide pyruvyl transferase WcaK-like protein
MGEVHSSGSQNKYEAVTRNLYMRREDAARVAAGPSVIILIGGWTGFPNYGDELQFLSTARMYREANVVSPVVVAVEDERVCWKDGDEGRALLGDVMPMVVCKEPPSNWNEIADGSEFITLEKLPKGLFVHLFGGGYINEYWGAKYLDIVSSVLSRQDYLPEDMARVLVASGLQVSKFPNADGWSQLLSTAAFCGVRDEQSGAVVKCMSGLNAVPPTVWTGDDAAIEITRRMAAEPADSGRRRLGCHASLASYTTADREMRKVLFAEGVARIAAAADRPISCEFLIAHRSDFVEEEYHATLVEQEIASLAEVRKFPCPVFSRRVLGFEPGKDLISFPYDIVITGSYHIALTGLIKGIPTALLETNAYYAQKALGLTEWFGSPPLTVVRCAEDFQTLLGEFRNSASEIGHHTASALTKAAVARLSAERRMLGAYWRMTADLEARDFGKVKAAFREVSSQLGELRMRQYEYASGTWSAAPQNAAVSPAMQPARRKRSPKERARKFVRSIRPIRFARKLLSRI